jgi:hypothetical protein
MIVELPAKCFISHAYGDAPALDRLLAGLPAGVQTHVFPPIVVAPDQLVSTRLIEALLECDGLIYLSGGSSDASFWVAFERDYALRAGKQVFSADAGTLEVTRHLGNALDLATFGVYCQPDAPRVRDVAKFLKRERCFDLWLDVEDLQPGVRWDEEIKRSLEDKLNRGGYVIVFWSQYARESDWVRREIQRAAEGIPDFNDRVLFALLDDAPLPDFWLRFHEPAVQLYADGERAGAQRIDDLVVRLYWLIYRKTKHKHLDRIDA